MVVLVAVALLSLAALTFGEMMLVERQAAELAARQVQARALTDSGVAMAALFASQPLETLAQSGGLYNNSSQFQHQVVIDANTPHDRGCFTIVAPDMDSQGNYSGIRYGFEDESAKINLNALALIDAKYPGQNIGRQILMNLPGMTEDIADSILDFIDADDDPRDEGAESQVYTGLDPPYSPKNGPLDNLEELLLVRTPYGNSITPPMLFGVDANRNGSADPEEPDPSTIGIDDSDGSMDRGWSAYLTLWGMEANISSSGTARVNVNQSDLQQLYTQLSQVLDEPSAAFIVACRLSSSGPTTPGSTAGAGGSTGAAKSSSGPAKSSGGGGAAGGARRDRSLHFGRPTRSHQVRVVQVYFAPGLDRGPGFGGDRQWTDGHCQGSVPPGLFHEHLPSHAHGQSDHAKRDGGLRTDQHQPGLEPRAVEHPRNDFGRRPADYLATADGPVSGRSQPATSDLDPHRGDRGLGDDEDTGALYLWGWECLQSANRRLFRPRWPRCPS